MLKPFVKAFEVKNARETLKLSKKKQKVTTLYEITEAESVRTALPEILLKLSGTHS